MAGNAREHPENSEGNMSLMSQRLGQMIKNKMKDATLDWCAGRELGLIIDTKQALMEYQ